MRFRLPRWLQRTATSVALWFGLAYIALIFVFATIYWFMPGQFYHTTVIYEASMREDAEAIKRGLRDALVRQYEATHDSDVVVQDDFVASLDNFVVTEFELISQGIKFKGHLPRDPQSKGKLLMTPVVIILFQDLPQPKEMEIGQDNVLRYVFGMDASFSETEAPDDFAGVKTWDGSIFTGLTRIPRSLEERVTAYSDALKGFPGRATGSFWRMFYLSTVTITTLGYGDITPITPSARFFIAIEAILGTLIIGLYVAVLAERLGRIIKQRGPAANHQEPR